MRGTVEPAVTGGDEGVFIGVVLSIALDRSQKPSDAARVSRKQRKSLESGPDPSGDEAMGPGPARARWSP